MNEYEARITRLERELAALRAASAEMVAALNAWRDSLYIDDKTEVGFYQRLIVTLVALEALLAGGETDER